MYFSGHSHLHVNDERSIWQGGFTAVNDGSMSYGETPHDAYQIDGDALFDEFTIPSAQALYVEVYADRTEIDRVNFAAEDERTIVDGTWGAYQQSPPFASAGTLAGPTWTVRLEGTTPDQVRANFDYTSAARDKIAPTFATTPVHRLTEDGEVLRVAAATDDEAVYGDDLRVRDAATGALALPIRAGAKVLADFQIAPRPSVLDIPLAVRAAGGGLVTLTAGTEYVAEVTAVDMYGNRSETKSVEFVSGEDAAQPAGLKLSAAASEVIPGEAASITTTFTNQSDVADDRGIRLAQRSRWLVHVRRGRRPVRGSSPRERSARRNGSSVPPTGTEPARHTLTAKATYASSEGAASITRRTALTTVVEGSIPRSRLSIADVSSEGEAASEGAANAIDGDSASLWHSRYSPAPAATFPHWITLDLGSEHVLDGLRYLPRQAGTNGNLKDYEIHVSQDNVEWGEPVATGSFGGGLAYQQVDFAATVGRYIRLTGLSAQNGLAFGAAAEVAPLGHLASPRPDVEVTAATTMAGPHVKLTVAVENRDSVPVDVKVLTAFGAHTFDDLKPGKTTSHPFTTGQASVDAGVAVAELTAQIDGETVTRNVVAGYTAPDTTRPQVRRWSPPPTPGPRRSSSCRSPRPTRSGSPALSRTCTRMASSSRAPSRRPRARADPTPRASPSPTARTRCGTTHGMLRATCRRPRRSMSPSTRPHRP